MSVRKLLPLIALALMPGSVGAAETTAPFKLSAADLDHMANTTAGGKTGNTLPTGKDGPVVLVIRRTANGEPEIHDQLNDIFIVRSGHATVLVGGRITGNHQTAAGEWRGGTLTGAAGYKMDPGDILWIPAGLPHQVLVRRGSDFKYLAFKSKG